MHRRAGVTAIRQKFITTDRSRVDSGSWQGTARFAELKRLVIIIRYSDVAKSTL